MAERTKLTAYIIFSLFNTIVYCVPAHWIWADEGFLKVLGVIDIAGSGAVHLVGGVSGLVATMMLKPRIGRYDDRYATPQPGNPTNCMVGMFMLWWGWLGFNCGSTFGISGGKWKLAAKAAVTTLNSSMGGGAFGLFYSYLRKGRKYMISDLVNGVLGGLVAVTAGCAIVRPWEALIIGLFGGIFAVPFPELLDKFRIDDPVGAVAVHGVSGIWGMLSVGVFAELDPIQDLTSGRAGLVRGGGFYLLGVQALACVCIIAWSIVVTWVLLLILDKTMGIRLSPEEEILGADLVEHGIGGDGDIQLPKTSNSILPEENGNVEKMENGTKRHNSEPDISDALSYVVRRRSSFGLRTTSKLSVPPKLKHDGIDGPFTPTQLSTITMEVED